MGVRLTKKQAAALAFKNAWGGDPRLLAEALARGLGFKHVQSAERLLERAVRRLQAGPVGVPCRVGLPGGI